jgi:PAS domain S-box-containing protein
MPRQPAPAPDPANDAGEERLRTVTQNMPVMMDAFDAAGAIVFWNRECERVTGYSAAEIVGNPQAMQLLYPDQAYREQMLAEWAARGGDHREWEWETTCKDGSVRIVAWSNISHHFPVSGWASWGIGVDVTERKRAEAALREALAAAAAREQELERARASLEIRSANLAHAIAELELEIAEHTHAEEALRASEAQLREREELFRALFEHSPDAILLIDPVTFTIVDCNPVTCQMNGYSREELIGQPADMLNEVRVAEEMKAAYIDYLQRVGSLKYELNHRRADGLVFPIEVSAAVIRLSGRELLLGIDRDISERRRIENAEREQRALAEALRDTAAALNSTLHLDEVLDYILANVGRVLSHDAASIMLVEDEVAYVVRRLGYAEAGFETTVMSLRFRVADAPTLRQMSETGQPLAIPDTRTYSGWLDRLATRWVRSYAGAPIRLKGAVIGFLNLNSGTPDFFTAAHAERLRAFADQAATAIENARLFQAAQRRLDEMAAVLAAGAAISSSLDLTTILSRLAEHMGQAVDATSVYICDWDPVMDTTTVLAEYYGPGASPEERVSDLGITYRQSEAFGLNVDFHALLAHESPVLFHVDDPRTPERTRAHVAEYGGRSVLVVPFVSKGRILGYADLWESRRHRDFTPPEIALCQGIARHAAVALENAGLYAAARRSNEELEQRVAERTAELESERQRMETILNAMAEGICLTDRDRIMRYVNPGLEQIAGYPAAELLGQNPRVMKSGLTSPAIYDEMQRALERGEAWRGDVINRRKDGTLYDAALTITPLKDAEGEIVGFVGSQRDITYLKELDRLKNQFVSQIGHELRTPLTNVKLHIELLEHGKPDKREEYIRVLHTETRRLQKIIEGFLDISQFDAGAVSIRSIPLDLNQLAEDVIASCRAQAVERGLALHFQPDPNLSRTLADPTLIHQVMSNLMDNAFNYTPRGGSISLLTAGYGHEEQDWITFTVRDTGPGISADELPHLFERFYRGAAARNFITPGAGLGLATCKEIVDRLGGRITVESSGGAAFTVWLRSLSD